MEISNVRLGFANNSSSSHSIIWWDKESPPGNGEYISDFCFGWEAFTLSTEEDKAKYMVVLFFYNLEKHFGAAWAKFIINSMFGVKLPKARYETDITDQEFFYVDHQSTVNLPLCFDKPVTNLQFMGELFTYITTTKEIVILGGNDNDGSHPLTALEIKNWQWVERDCSENNIVARWDKSGYWTLLNRENGTKFRLSFTGEVPNKSSAPELVDLKITNFCPFGCPFCYQSRTISGKHAPLSDITDIIYELGKMEVLEIAFGGGEPTLHPDFTEIAEECRKNHIVPNFTTRNYKWLEKNIDWVKKTCGSVALSVDPDNYYKTTGIYRELSKEMPSISMQLVMGTIERDDYKRFLRECKEFDKLVLLGFKEVGEGINYPRKNYDWWLDDTKKSKLASIGIDTALASEYKQKLKDHEISERLYFTEEGKYSMYIDIVEKKMGRSSYHQLESFAQFEYFSSSEILKAYKEW